MELTSLLVVSINVTNRFSLVVIFSSLMVVSLASNHFPFLIASLVGSCLESSRLVCTPRNSFSVASKPCLVSLLGSTDKQKPTSVWFCVSRKNKREDKLTKLTKLVHIQRELTKLGQIQMEQLEDRCFDVSD